MWNCMCLLFFSFSIFIVIFSFGFFFNNYNTNLLNSRKIIEVQFVRDVTTVDHNLNNNNKVIEVKKVIGGNKVKQHVPKFMLDLYEKSKNVPRTHAPDIVRSVLPTRAETIYPNSNLFNDDTTTNNHMLIFNIPSTNKDESLIRAELRLLTLIELKHGNLTTSGLEREIKISTYNETNQQYQTLDMSHIYHTTNTWLLFNVTNAVDSLLKTGSDSILKLVITIKTYMPVISKDVGVFKLSLMPVEENFEHDYPILLLYYKNEHTTAMMDKKRMKRMVEDDYEEETNKIWDETDKQQQLKRLKRIRNTCKRKPLYVDFTEIEFDTWIVQPTGYEAYQCAGKCFYPVAEHLSPTKHAIVQALLHSVAPSKAPRSCCVPSKLDSISVLYVDANGVLTYRYSYKDMVVAECGCR